MAKAIVFLLIVILWVLLAGTVEAADTAAPPIPSAHRYFMPNWYAPAPVKLGLSGGTVAQAQVLGASWLYDWTAQPPVREWFESVPMIGRDWGDGPVPAVGGNSAYLLGFNEPDIAIQSNITPERAARLWRQIEAAYPRKLLVSPAPSGEGRYWLVQMRLAYRELFGSWPRFDALAMHCYQWTATACDAVLRDYRAWVRDWQIPGGIWVTEFAFQRAWTADPEREARTFVAMLEATPEVRRYAPFVAHTERGVWYWPYTSPQADPSLFCAAGSTELTDVGKWYAR